jgi:hypothetical protein
MALIQCPNCTRPVVIPDQADVKPLQEQVARLQASLEAKVDGVTKAMGSHPKPSRELLDLWSNCPDCAPLWNRIREELNELARKKVHVRPSLALIREFEGCPECKEEWQRMLEDSPELFKPAQSTGKFWFWEKERYGFK